MGGWVIGAYGTIRKTVGLSLFSYIFLFLQNTLANLSREVIDAIGRYLNFGPVH